MPATILELDDLAPTWLCLGKLISDFQTLELVLRVCLNRERPAGAQAFTIIELEVATEGTAVPLSAFTDYRSLRDLILAFNSSLRIQRADAGIDATLVDIRDALAHGRVFARQPGPPLRLLKFGRPHDSWVPVEFAIDVTPDWLTAQSVRVTRAIEAVHPFVS